MDTEQFWQENKRFITTLLAGLLVFFIGNTIVNRLYKGGIDAANGATARALRDLRGELYTASDRGLAEDENAALKMSYDTIVEAAAFRPRPEFSVKSSETAKQDYNFAVEAMRERLSDLASQRRAFLPDGLDLEFLQTTNVDAIERHLHAVDLLERALATALDSGVRRVRRIGIELDPAFRSRRGLGAIERTKVTVDTESTAEAVTQWLATVETPEEGAAVTSIRGQALPIESLEMSRVSTKDDEVRTVVTFLVVRVHEVEEAEE